MPLFVRKLRTCHKTGSSRRPCAGVFRPLGPGLPPSSQLLAQLLARDQRRFCDSLQRTYLRGLAAAVLAAVGRPRGVSLGKHAFSRSRKQPALGGGEKGDRFGRLRVFAVCASTGALTTDSAALCAGLLTPHSDDRSVARCMESYGRVSARSGDLRRACLRGRIGDQGLHRLCAFKNTSCFINSKKRDGETVSSRRLACGRAAETTAPRRNATPARCYDKALLARARTGPTKTAVCPDPAFRYNTFCNMYGLGDWSRLFTSPSSAFQNLARSWPEGHAQSWPDFRQQENRTQQRSAPLRVRDRF